MELSERSWPLIVFSAVVVAGAFALYGPYPQWPSYYGFADDRTMLGIPNALNVLSNIVFVIVGLIGTREVFGWPADSPSAPHAIHYKVFFVGLILTGLGSAYFHWEPNTPTLVWDRLPMTILFASFLCSVISELIERKPARILLPIVLLFGAISVFYWGHTELDPELTGDMRPYGIAQYLPLALVLLILLSYRARLRPGYAAAIGYLYFSVVAAKTFEHFDDEIFAASGFISGHSLKHLMAGLSGAYLLLWLRQRNEQP